MAKSQHDVEAEVRSWGFSHVFTWSDGPNARQLLPSNQETSPTLLLLLVTSPIQC